MVVGGSSGTLSSSQASPILDVSSFPSMAAVRLPELPCYPTTRFAAQDLRTLLRHEHRIEVSSFSELDFLLARRSKNLVIKDAGLQLMPCFGRRHSCELRLTSYWHVLLSSICSNARRISTAKPTLSRMRGCNSWCSGIGGDMLAPHRWSTLPQSNPAQLAPHQTMRISAAGAHNCVGGSVVGTCKLSHLQHNSRLRTPCRCHRDHSGLQQVL